jgi:WD40 repeat protein
MLVDKPQPLETRCPSPREGGARSTPPFRIPLGLFFVASAVLSALSLAFALAGDAPAQVAEGGAGDPGLPKGAIARLGVTRWRHGGTVTFAAFMPDGKGVLSASDDGVLHVWDYPSGKELRHFRVGEPSGAGLQEQALTIEPGNFPVAMAPNGKTAAVMIIGEVWLYEVATGRPLGCIDSQREFSQAAVMAFSPDSELLAILETDTTVRLWDWAKNKPVGQFAGPSDNGAIFFGERNNGLAFSPDGKMLAVSGLDLINRKVEYNIKLWDVDSSKELFATAPVRNSSFAVPAFSPDGKTLAFVAANGTIHLVNTQTGKAKREMPGDNGGFKSTGRGTISLVFSDDGRRIFSGTTTEIATREWDSLTANQTRVLGSVSKVRARNRNVLLANPSLVLSPDGKTLLRIGAGGEHVIHFVDVASGKEIGEPDGYSQALVNVQFGPDGNHVLTKAADGSVQFWAVPSQTPKWEGLPKELPAPKLVAQGIVQNSTSTFSDNGLVAASLSGAVGSRSLVVHEAKTGKEISRVAAPQRDTINPAMLFSPTGSVLAIRWQQEQRIELYSAATAKKIQVLPIVSGRSEIVGVKDAMFGRVATKIAPATMIFSTDGQSLAAYLNPHTMAVWDVTSGRRKAIFTAPHHFNVLSGAFAPDDRCLALDLSDGSTAIYELATGTPRHVFGRDGLDRIKPRSMGLASGITVNGQAGPHVAFAGRGQTIAYAGTDNAVQVWDLVSGKKIADWAGHGGPIHSLAMSPDGKTLASASADTTVLLWDMAKLEKPVRFVDALDSTEAWKTLGNQDAAVAIAALCDLTASPADAVALFARQLRPAPPLDKQFVQKLIGQMDDPQYKKREQATSELMKIGERVVPALEKTLASTSSFELQKRLEVLRAKLNGSVYQGDALRAFRAIEVLERIGDTAAKKLLRTLADGSPDAFITSSAKEAVKRLGYE